MTLKFVTYVGWTIILSASLYFVYTNALHYFSYTSDSFESDFWPFAPYLLTHIIGGMTALLLGPFQFISQIRKKYPRIHHTIGKIYLCGILVGASASLYMSIVHDIVTAHLVTFGTGLIGLALAWLTTAGLAYWAVRNRNFVQHREWMIRSYVVTCGFTTFRLLTNFLGSQFHIPFSVSGDIMAWACWAFPLLITEAILQGNKIHRTAKAFARKKENERKPYVTITTVLKDKTEK